MTTVQVLSLAIFAGILLVSVGFRINIGAVALPAAFLLSSIAGIGTGKVLTAFPGDLVILIIGVTLLFAHVQRSGAIGWSVEFIVRLAGPRRWLIPWVGFALAAILGTIGGLPAAVVAIVIPIVAELAQTYRISYLMMAVMADWAAIAAGMSPLSPAGALLRTLTQHAHLAYSPWALYGIVMAVHTVAAIIFCGIFSSARLRRAPEKAHITGQQESVLAAYAAADQAAGPSLPAHGAVAATDIGSGPASPAPAGRDGAITVATATRNRSGGVRPAYRIAALGALVILVVAAVGFNADIGLSALSLALLLQLIFRPPEKEMLGSVAWSVVLLLAGLLIYLNVLLKLGTLHNIQHALHGISNPIIAVLVLVYVTALFSNMDSSTIVVLGVMAPIGLAISGGSPTAVLAVLVAVATAIGVISVSPVHINGSLIIANTPDKDEHRLFRRLIYLTTVISLVVPALIAIYPIAVGA